MSLRARLSRIARGDADPRPGQTSEPLAEDASLCERKPAQPWALDFDPAEGSEVRTDAGKAWRVELALPAFGRGEQSSSVCGTPPEAVCIDIETAGLSAAPLFLVGLLWREGEGARLVQLVARDYSEEAAVLEILAETVGGAPHWVTYNGATFDLPYLRDRCGYHRVTPPACAEHTDLLPLARRQWRGSLADCRLLTVEREICGRRRLQDVVGAAIPGLYHEFVRTARWEVLAPVLHHNAMDLATTAELWERIGRTPAPGNVRFR